MAPEIITWRFRIERTLAGELARIYVSRLHWFLVWTDKQARRYRDPSWRDVARLLALQGLGVVPAIEITGAEVSTVPLIAKATRKSRENPRRPPYGSNCDPAPLSGRDRQPIVCARS